jgi:CRP-like cAMP-binding protein
MITDPQVHECLLDRIREVSVSRSVGASTVMVAKRSNVYNAGQTDSNVYVLERGRVKLTMYSADGKVCLLSVHGPGEIFGQECLLHAVRESTACAAQDTVLRRIPSAKFLAALGDEGVLEDFIRYLVQQITEQQQAIMGFVTMDSQRRLAAVLLHLAGKFGRRHAHGRLRINEHLTQEELSDMVGTTRSRVGYFLKGFGETGMLEYDRDGLIILDENRLKAYVGREPLPRIGGGRVR